MSLTCKVTRVVAKRSQCSNFRIQRLFADHSSKPAAPTPINSVIWAGIVVKKYNFVGMSAIIQNHTGLKIPVKSFDKNITRKLQELELGTNVLINGSLDQEKVVRQVDSGYRRVDQNFINASELEIIEPEQVKLKKEERSSRIASNFSR